MSENGGVTGLAVVPRRLATQLTFALLALAAFFSRASDEKPVGDLFEATREVFLERINAERADRGLRPLRLCAPLSRVAQSRADRLAREDSPLDSASAEEDSRLAAKAGYDARFVSEVIAHSEGDVDFVIASSKEPSNAMNAEIGRKASRDLGVGVARRDETPLYVFLFGLGWEEFFSDSKTALSDLERVRRDLLERLNRERASRGLLPLQPHPLLNEAAQKHAADMLTRTYYGHESPDGTTVLERTRTLSYRPRFVAENVARGQYSVEEVMDGWMTSQEHREHILSKLFSDVGSGLAIGKNANGYQVLWVQCFGRPKDLLPSPRTRSQNPSRTANRP